VCARCCCPAEGAGYAIETPRAPPPVCQRRNPRAHQPTHANTPIPPCPLPSPVRQARLPPHAQPEGGSLGTGYPHDEATKGWLAGNVDAVFGFHPIVRFSWETAAR
jgi:hypothetical protein